MKNSKEEELLLKGLLSELDDTFLDSSSVKQNTTIKRANSAPEKTSNSNQYDFDALLEGMDWDWDDMELEVNPKVCSIK